MKKSGEALTADKESDSASELGNSNSEANLSQREKRGQGQGVGTGNESRKPLRTKVGFENQEADLWIICHLNMSALC